MSLLQSEDDFLVVVDKKEPLELLRPQSDLILDISAAWRMSGVHRMRNGSTVEADEILWFLADASLGGETPFLGDILRDATACCWTISEITHLDKIGCWKCRAIDMKLRYGLDGWVDWYRPQWTLDGQGIPTPEYRLVRSGIPARLVWTATTFEKENQTQVEKQLERNQKQPRPKLDTVEIWIHQPHLKVGYRDCFVTPENRGFRVVEFRPAASWKELSCILAEEIHYER